MRVSVILLLVVMVFVGCENPGEMDQTVKTYQGQVIQTESAPFLLNSNGLAKVADGTAIIEESTADGTVFGLETETTVYAADGGEALPKDTWIDNLTSDPIEVSISSGLVITFDGFATITLMDAIDITYVDADGQTVVFSGSGVISTTEISTGEEGSATLISTVKFGIGGEGGDTA